jgi:hypothetical protein
MNEYTVSEHELKDAKFLMRKLLRTIHEGVLTVQDLEESSLIAAGMIQWFNNIKENNLIIIKGEENDDQFTKETETE